MLIKYAWNINIHLPACPLPLPPPPSPKYQYKSRKFYRGISCSSHLAITYGVDLLYLWIFSQPKPPNSFVWSMHPFLMFCTHLGHAVNIRQQQFRIDHTKWSHQIQRYDNATPYHQNGRHNIPIKQGLKRDPIPPCKIPWYKLTQWSELPNNMHHVEVIDLPLCRS